MRNEYKISEEQYFAINQKFDFHILLFMIFYFLVIIATGLYVYEEIWSIIAIFGGPVFIIFDGFYRSKKNSRTLLNDYSITFENSTITEKRSAISIAMFYSQPGKVKRIKYDNITEIKKTGNDSLIIKEEEEENQLNVITIPAYMENYDALEKELESIHPISNLLVDTFVIRKDGIENFQSYFLFRLLPGILVIVSLLTIFLTGPKTKNDWIALSIIFGSILILFILVVFIVLKRRKKMYDNYRFTFDEQVIIQELNMTIITIPINEITKIKKSYNGAIRVVGNKGLSEIIIIPAEIEKREILERKLNRIKSITQSIFLKWKKV